MTARKNILGERLRVLREQKKLTQTMLAARCGANGWDVSENIITRIERGFRCLSDFEILALSKALHIKPGELFER